ncbi:14015_t:CDS:10 [Ambispora leptoticha]|uniref:Chromatin modification-related protein EAF6 n=1 Tax=Ambispora leptoticha TaxID=144679 RepID=A0A9N8YPZ9_9GLOM|nr:14015_t:CDS:10 [Ambispora leptoticha]
MADTKKPADSSSKPPAQETSQPATVGLPKAVANGSNKLNKLKAIQAELDKLLIEKKKADFSLAEIEFSIYNFEGSYLKETHNGKGNLLRGFFGKVPKSALDKHNPKKFEVREEDRIFSRSSVTYEQSVAMKEAQKPNSNNSSDAHGNKSRSNLRKKRKHPGNAWSVKRKNRPREENLPTSSVGDSVGGVDESTTTTNNGRVTSKKSLKSIRTIYSTDSINNGKKDKKVTAKRRSNYSYVSTYSNASTHVTKESLSSDFTEGGVVEEPQDIVGIEHDEPVSSILVVDYNSGKGGGNEAPEKSKEQTKAIDLVERTKKVEIDKEASHKLMISQTHHHQSRRRNTLVASLTAASASSASSPLDAMRPNLSIITGSTFPRKNMHHLAPHLHPFSQFPVSPLDFTFSRKRHESISTSGQDPPSPFTGSKKLAQAAIVEGLEMNELIHAFLLEMLIKKQVTDRTTVYNLPRPFIVIALLPLSNTRYKLPSQLLDRFFISYTYEGIIGNSGSGKAVSSSNRKNNIVRYNEIEDFSKKMEKVFIHNDMQRYIRDVVIGMRTHRIVKGGITARTASDLVTLVKALAVVFQKNFVTPELVLIASEKVFSHRLIIRELGDDKSTMYGTSLHTLLKLRSQVTSGGATQTLGDVVADVLQAVRPPI